MYVFCGFAGKNYQLISICIKIFMEQLFLKYSFFHVDNREVFCGTLCCVLSCSKTDILKSEYSEN